MMSILYWFLLVLQAFALGALLVQFLTAPMPHMNAWLAAACLIFASSTLFVSLRMGSVWVVALPIALLAFLAGYGCMAAIVLGRKEVCTLPVLQRKAGDPGKGHRAVIYFTHGESPLYQAQSWINQFREFDEQHIRFIPFLARPFFLFQLRRHYLMVGKSDHRQTHQRMLARLEESFRARGDVSTRFYLSFLDDAPHPDEAAIRALNEGASQLLLAEIFLTDSNHTAEGCHMVAEAVPPELNIDVRHTRPLWDSGILQSVFVERACEACRGTPKEKTGILLVGHGQPEEWDREFASETSQETAFRQAVVDHLVEAGFPRENISQAWMEFRLPKTKEGALRLAERKVDKLLVFSTAISADGIHSQYDVPAQVERAVLPATIEVINMGGWNDHPRVIEAIRARIMETLEE
jgi:protoheme ferro-lyase